jgi:glycosyltransferase involved in cell wall biosynthesis
VRILFGVHGFPPRANAGTETYVHALAHALVRGGDEVAVLSREADPGRPEFATRRERVDGLDLLWVNNCFRHCRSLDDTYLGAEVRRTAAARIDELRPDVAHLHHLTGLGLDLVDELAARRVPTVLTVNDFWMICQRGQLLDLDLRRCGGPWPAGCARCLHTDERSAALRTERVRAALAAVDVVLCPSQTVRDAFARFGVSSGRLLRQEQGIDLAPFAGRERPVAAPTPLRVAFAGSLMASKAPHLLLAAAAGLPRERVRVRLAGEYVPYHGDDRYRATLEAAAAASPAELLGALDRAGVVELLHDSDVLVVPSVWLENAPFVIKEAFAAGVPVVASALGGMAELVRHEENGLLFAPGDAGALRDALRRLIEEPELLARLRRGLPRVASIEEDARATRRLYERLRSSGPPPS